MTVHSKAQTLIQIAQKRMKKWQDNYRATRILLSQQQNSNTSKRVHPKHMITEMAERTNYGSQWSVAALLKITRAYSLQFQTHSKPVCQKTVKAHTKLSRHTQKMHYLT